MDKTRQMEAFASAPLDSSVPTFQWDAGLREADTVAGLKRDIIRHIVSSLGLDYARRGEYNYYHGLALAVRDRMVDQWIRTQRSYYEDQSKRVYYLSMEYLPGKSLLNNLHCLGIYDEAKQALAEFGLELENVAEVEWDAGLGNGGLGRLASCYLDSMATKGISGYGYGIRYDYGIFRQEIRDGFQVEEPDNWLRNPYPWEIERPEYQFPVHFGGRVQMEHAPDGELKPRWIDYETAIGIPYDLSLIHI